MKRCTYCGRENQEDALSCRECQTQFVDPSAGAKPQGVGASECGSPRGVTRDLGLHLKSRWVLGAFALVALAVALGLLLSRYGPKANAPRVVFLATWYSNGEQLVTFRPDPPSADILEADLVSASYDGNAQPQTVRSFGSVHPVRNETETNSTLHFVALPRTGASVRGKLLAYTPGSYTVAYTPTESAHRVRVEVALKPSRAADYLGRLRNCWEEKTLTLLRRKSYGDPVFVTSETITNAAPRTQ